MSGRYVTVETEVWIDDSDVEMYLEDFSDDELIRELEKRKINSWRGKDSLENLVHQLYVARIQDNTREFDRLMNDLFQNMLGKRP